MKNNLLWMALVGLVLTSCDISVSTGLELSSGDISIYPEETAQIIADAPTNISYESANDFIAKASSSGLVTAGRVGNTEVTVSDVSDEELVMVEVLPNYTTYTTPLIDWNLTKSDIISDLGTPDELVDEDNIIYYNTEDKVEYLMYTFDASDVLIASSVIISKEYEDELNSFLTERYKYWDEQGDIAILIDAFFPADATLLVGLTEVAEIYQVVIYQGNGTKKSAKVGGIEQIKEAAIKMIK